MNLVYVTPFLRIPADFGSGIRNYQFLKYLSERHSITLVTYGDDSTGKTDAWLTEQGCQVIRLPIAIPYRQANRRDALRNAFTFPPSFFRRYPPHALSDCLKELTATRQIDCIILDTQLTGQCQLVQRFAVPCVLQLTDVYQILLKRKIKLTGVRPYTTVYLAEWLKTRAYENRILKHSPDIVTVSPDDAWIIRRITPRSSVSVIPNGVDVDYYAPTDAVSKNASLIFVGGFEYSPNADALEYFYRDIFPLIRAKHSQVRLVGVGRNPPASLQNIAQQDKSVTITGTVSDVRPYYRASAVAVVPLRYGSGTKLKLLEAFAAGVPVVSTSIGCEGVSVVPNEHLFVADTPQQFADSVCKLLNDRILAQKMAEQARNLIKDKYDWNMIVPQFEECLMQAGVHY